MQVAALLSIVVLAALATDFVVPILPIVESELNTSAANAQMLISVFLAGYALGQIPCGVAADRIGRMPVLYFSLGVFLVGSIVCVLSDSISSLFAGRIIQGLGAAGTAVMSRTLARDLRSGPELTKLLALYVAVLASLPIIGPVVGGWLGAVVSWQSVFVFLPLAVVLSIMLCLFGLRESMDRGGTGFNNVENQKNFKTALQQFVASRQSIWASLLLGFGFFGFMSILSGFSNVIVDVYQRPAIHIGPILSAAMLFFVGGSVLSRVKVGALGEFTLIKFAFCIFLIATVFNSYVFIMQPVSMIWFLLGVTSYMFGLGLLFPNTTAVALAPLPHIAGLASSLLGTIQISFAFAGSALTASLYKQNLDHIAIPLMIAGIGVIVLYLIKSRFLSGKLQ
ncbi:MAG: MFS transporter [Pseudomonadales bacterium]